jgi:hypothetical protein
MAHEPGEVSEKPRAEELLPLSGRVVCLVAVSRFVPFLRLHFWGSGVPNSSTGPDYTLQIEGPMTITLAGEPSRSIRRKDPTRHT